MIKITNEIDGKKYELIPRLFGCYKCAFDGCTEDCFRGCTINKAATWFQGKSVCEILHGIWKEVCDAD